MPQQPPPASSQPATGRRGQDRRQGDVHLGDVQPDRGLSRGAAEAVHSALTFAHSQDPPEVSPRLMVGPAEVEPRTRPKMMQTTPEPTFSCLVRISSTIRAHSTTATATALTTPLPRPAGRDRRC